MDKTLKLHALSDDDTIDVTSASLASDQGKSPDMQKKIAQMEEKILDQFRIIEQLRESLKLEQVKSAELAKRAVGPDADALAVKDAQLEEEKSRSLENLKMIVQLRASLKQEQEKTVEIARKMAEQDAKVRSLAELEANELAKKNAQIDEVKSKSLGQEKVIEQLSDSLKQEQAKSAGMTEKLVTLEAKAATTAALEAQVKTLTEAISQISKIAAGVRAA